MGNTPLYNDLFPPSYAKDDFGYSSEWSNEIEKWLVAAKSIDKCIYKKQKNRVKKAKQRDELLGEYKAMYVAKEMWHMRNIKYTDEENATEKTVDFTFNDSENNTWKVEVKSPSWLAELAEDLKNGSITKEQFLERKEKPQFINGEGRWLGFSIFKNPIKNAIKKFKSEENNLLFLCPNTFGPLSLAGEMEDWHKLRKIISELDTERKITTVCYLDVGLYHDGFKYIDQLIKITNLPVITK